MRHSTFWRGIVWGWGMAMVCNAMFGSLRHARRKPLMERGSDAIRAATHELFGEAYRLRKHLIRRLH